jgi:hypothetical protein
MGDKKHLCAYKKSAIKEDLDKFKELVRDPRFICRKCARAARDKDRLCQPEKLRD